jgi:redox-sensitive bicupin YhaK (pirin superfamily)
MQASAMHRGLQMVSWLIPGEVLHVQRGQLPLVPPGQLNSMNPGHAISHSEESPLDHSPILPGAVDGFAGTRSQVDLHFGHHSELPVLTDSDVTVTLIMNERGSATRRLGSASNGSSRPWA